MSIFKAIFGVTDKKTIESFGYREDQDYDSDNDENVVIVRKEIKKKYSEMAKIY